LIKLSWFRRIKNRRSIVYLNIFILVKWVIVLQYVEKVTFIERNGQEVILLWRVINSVTFLCLFCQSSVGKLTFLCCPFVVLYPTQHHVPIRRIFELHHLFILKFIWVSYCHHLIHFFHLLSISFSSLYFFILFFDYRILFFNLFFKIWLAFFKILYKIKILYIYQKEIKKM
jgi:hypothetical protein